MSCSHPVFFLLLSHFFCHGGGLRCLAPGCTAHPPLPRGMWLAQPQSSVPPTELSDQPSNTVCWPGPFGQCFPPFLSCLVLGCQSLRMTRNTLLLCLSWTPKHSLNLSLYDILQQRGRQVELRNLLFCPERKFAISWMQVLPPWIQTGPLLPPVKT